MNPRNWAARMARYHAISEWRRDQTCHWAEAVYATRKGGGAFDPKPGPLDELIRREDGRRFRALLARLTGEDARLGWMLAAGTPAVVAYRMLGVTPSAGEGRLRRLRDRLAEEAERLDIELPRIFRAGSGPRQTSSK